MEGLALVGKYFWVVRRGSPAAEAFIMRHECFSYKELYSIKRMVYITEEVPKEDLFCLDRPSLGSSIASEVVPPEEGVERFRYKKYEETPLHIPSSESRWITVTEAAISTLRRKGISVDEDKDPVPENFLHVDPLRNVGFHV